MHKGKRLLLAVPARCGARARTDDHRPRDDRARHDLDGQRADGALVHPCVEADADIELWPEPEQRADVRVQAGQGRGQACSHCREPLYVVVRSLFASDIVVGADVVVLHVSSLHWDRPGVLPRLEVRAVV